MTLQQKIDYITALIDEVMYVQDGLLMKKKAKIELAYSRLLEQSHAYELACCDHQPSFLEYLQKFYDGTIVV